jgi:hypothetical protein
MKKNGTYVRLGGAIRELREKPSHAVAKPGIPKGAGHSVRCCRRASPVNPAVQLRTSETDPLSVPVRPRVLALRLCRG